MTSNKRSATPESVPPLPRKDSSAPIEWSGVRSMKPASARVPKAPPSSLPKLGQAAAESNHDVDEQTRLPTRVTGQLAVARDALRRTLNLPPELPQLWAEEEDADDGVERATEVAPWSKFIRLPEETLRELQRHEPSAPPPALADETARHAAATGAPPAPSDAPAGGLLGGHDRALIAGAVAAVIVAAAIALATFGFLGR